MRLAICTAFVLVLVSCRNVNGPSAAATPGLAPPTPPPAQRFDAELASTRVEALLVDEEETMDASGLEPARDEDAWRHVITPYIWTMRVDGNARIGGNDVVIDDAFHDLLDDLSFVIEGRYEGWKGKHGVVFDLTYARLESETDFGMTELDSTTDLGLAVVAYQRRFVDQEQEADGSGGVKVDMIAGVSFTYLDAELDIKGGPDAGSDESWFDPLLGLRSRFGFNHRWGGMIEALIGGFELLDGSDFFSMFSVVVGRRFENSNLYFGWRNLDLDYDDGDDLAFDVRLSGPLVGWEFLL
jgi:hypothetical protein